VHAEAAGLSSAFGAADCFASAGNASSGSAAIEPAKIVVAIRISSSPVRCRSISKKTIVAIFATKRRVSGDQSATIMRARLHSTNGSPLIASSPEIAP
jgi:hypothetical protein